MGSGYFWNMKGWWWWWWYIWAGQVYGRTTIILMMVMILSLTSIRTWGSFISINQDSPSFFLKETTMFCVTRSSDVSWKHNIIDYDNCDVDDNVDDNIMAGIWKDDNDDDKDRDDDIIAGIWNDDIEYMAGIWKEGFSSRLQAQLTQAQGSGSFSCHHPHPHLHHHHHH